jgi:hypothetical protein
LSERGATRAGTSSPLQQRQPTHLDTPRSRSFLHTGSQLRTSLP